MPTNTPNEQLEQRIDVDDEQSLQTWAKKFDVTTDQIREAVEAAGDQAPDVEMHLKGSRSTTNSEKVDQAT